MPPRLRSRIAAALLLAFVPAALPAPAAAREPRHTLWVVEGHGNRAYLLGSIHLARENLLPLPPVMETAFQEARFVVFEIDLDLVLGPAIAFFRRGFFWDGRTLESQLSPETWTLLQEVGPARGFDPGLFRRAKPWLAALLLTLGNLEGEGYSAEAGVDQQLFERAKQEGKPRRALESADDQLSFFNDLPAPTQELMLRSVLEPGEGDDDLDGLTEAWRTGDTRRLKRFLVETEQEVPGFFDGLLVQRNRNWIPRIEEMLAEGEPFLVVVGAAHLVGKDSVVQLLKKKGYKVRQL
jgi:hypothetical protein